MDVQSLVKYALEGIAVAAAAYYITKKKTNLYEIGTIALIAALTFLVLDQFSPGVAAGARQGSGFGIGYNLVGGQPQGDEDDDL